MADAVMMTVAAGSPAEAGKIARALIEARVAACVQAQPITSTFRWDGSVTEDSEVLLLVKTRAALCEAVERVVRTNHSYEVPEILAVPIVYGSRDYLEWLETETASSLK